MSSTVAWLLFVFGALCVGLLLGRGLVHLAGSEPLATTIRRVLISVALLIMIVAYFGLFGDFALIANAGVIALLVALWHVHRSAPHSSPGL